MFKLNKTSSSKKFYIILACEILAFLLILTFICYSLFFKKYDRVMGGLLHSQTTACEASATDSPDIHYDKFFRPSCSKILNTTDLNYIFFDEYFGKKPNEIQLNTSLLNTPEDTLINYYTILKSASYYEENSGKYAGCGSIGDGNAPYPVAYNFLSEEYKKELSYEEFLKSFKNIYHINLIKLKEIPLPEANTTFKRYFVELETIEGADKPMTNFGYYYGFIDLTKEKDSFKISNMDFYGEDFLCAPYHGWRWLGEAAVEIKYGEWCKLISGKPTTQTEDYTKNIYFDGTDGNKYMIQFLTITNNTDVEIAQYKLDKNGDYQRILLEPEKCLKNPHPTQ